MSNANDSRPSDAWLDGWFAHRDNSIGEYPRGRENPYNERTQRRSRAQWGRGYASRHNAVKHGFALEWDDAEDITETQYGITGNE